MTFLEHLDEECYIVPMPDDIQSHLIDLEMKISHQEAAIDELKTTVFDQGLQIDRLETKIKRMLERLESVDTAAPVGPGNEKPPHY